MSWCNLKICDAHSLAKARKEARLPQLRHLDVSFNDRLVWKSNGTSESVLPLLFQQGNSILNTLIVRKCCLESGDLHAVKSNNILLELTTLDMSFNLIGGALSVLLCQYLLHLQFLVLRACQINSDDLTSLSQASGHCRLPKLRHLDISHTNIGGKKRGLFNLFGGLKGFPSLINLILCDCSLELQDLRCLTQAKLAGKLPRIRHLDISLNGLSDHVGILSRDPITQREISWGKVVCCDD